MVEVKTLASMEFRKESVQPRMDNMEARFIGLDSSLQDYKASIDLSFQKLKLDMDSKFQTLMEAIASLRASRMEQKQMEDNSWYDDRSPHAGFQAIMLWMVAVRYEDQQKCIEVAEMRTLNFYTGQEIQELIFKKNYSNNDLQHALMASCCHESSANPCRQGLYEEVGFDTG
ncbi:hypothetical protein O6P43_026794 [Quillaja saponaria]|uniref:Uncharacterized protein n=1 Tax=Quillaja saponaria TaxID=32244 RepID=A0AAD7L4A7_QUISA|nr:hypothetical protein O6P43_026794 [Quillaja saponaria]